MTLTETLAKTQAQIEVFVELLHFVQLCFVRPFKLLFSLMTWKLRMSPVTYEDLKAKLRLLHGMGIFEQDYLRIFRNVICKSLADGVMCTFCNNIEKTRSPKLC